MTELRDALHALVDRPPVAPVDVEVVAARGARFIRRQWMLRGGAVALVLVVLLAAGLGLTRQSSDPGVHVAARGAGAPVSYADPASDGVAPATEPSLGSSAFEIVRVEWAPAPEGYSTSITIAGPATGEGSYISFGAFPSDVLGEACELDHFLTPGTTAFAEAYCGPPDGSTRRSIGRVQGSRVTSTPTSDGGTVLTATFDDSELPALLEAAGRKLFGLSAYTCLRDSESPRCELDRLSDAATSVASYRV
jgi:hypothetical protein